MDSSQTAVLNWDGEAKMLLHLSKKFNCNYNQTDTEENWIYLQNSLILICLTLGGLMVDFYLFSEIIMKLLFSRYFQIHNTQWVNQTFVDM